MVNNLIYGGVGILVGAAAGFAGGYFLAKHRLEADFEGELKSMRETYRVLRKEDELATPQKAAETLGVEPVEEENELDDYKQKLDEENELDDYKQKLDEANYIQPNIEPGVNVFADVHEEPEDEPIKSKRIPGKPYTITEEEFLSSVEDWNKFSLTYFSDDDVLVDDREDVVPDIAKVVGYDNLAGASDIIFVRNEKYGTDYEITIDDRSYAEVVLRIPKSVMPQGRISEDD